MRFATTATPVITRLEPRPPSDSAKHRARARKDLRRLVLTWCLSGRWHYAALLLSRTGHLLAREKYSAFAIDRVYANAPEGWGWVGRRLDRYLLNLPVHRGVRARFDFVVRNGTEAVDGLLAGGVERVAVLSVPCGLVRDLCTIYGALRGWRADLGERLVLYGLDLDFEGSVLEVARRRALEAAVPIRLVQASALDPRCWAWLAEREPVFAVINCIGLAPWLAPAELGRLLGRFAARLDPAGCVLVDRWNRGAHAAWGAAAEIHAHYHTDEEYRAHAAACGLVVAKTEILGPNEGMGYVLRRPTAGAGDPRGAGSTPG